MADETPAARAADEVTIEDLPAERLDELEPLWHALLDTIVLEKSVVPIRPAPESWPLRREVYRTILERPESFCLVARRGGRAIGYAMVKIEDVDAVWYTGKLQSELESLSVLPEERGNGVGGRLMDVANERLEELGVDDMVIGVDSINERALRFYEARGFKVGFLLMYGHPGGRSWAAFDREREAPYRSMWLPEGVPDDGDPSETGGDEP
jgi:ribosomal protein S18 acetylase RimI-like enzyme